MLELSLKTVNFPNNLRYLLIIQLRELMKLTKGVYIDR